MAAQTTNTVLMIRPAAFGSNPETAASNAFQESASIHDSTIPVSAAQEFDAVVAVLNAAGVKVIVVDDTPIPPRPDAVFPNNWISTHDDGTIVLYPMHAPSRRREVRPEVVELMQNKYSFHVRKVIDLSPWAERGQFLEGTGSMVLDRANGTAYACRSPRTDPAVFEIFCKKLGYEPVWFEAHDENGTPVYHTNVQMWVGTTVAAACLDAVPGLQQRNDLRARLLSTGRELLELSLAQMTSFAGNMLEMLGNADRNVLALSASAHAALTPSQCALLSEHASLVVTPVPVIERYSGGSLRCMLAEVFLPPSAE